MTRPILPVLLAVSIITGGDAQRDPVCASGERLYPHEQYCDYYYDCEDGSAILRPCPNGLAFAGRQRGLIDNCDYPHRVGCTEKGLAMGQTPIASPHCPWQFGLYAHERSCNRYWQCWNGTATTQLCPISLMYNEATSACDWPSNVEDCPINPICKGSVDGRVPLKKSCIMYWQCVGGYPQLQRCAAGMAFNRGSLACELSYNVPGCESIPGGVTPYGSYRPVQSTTSRDDSFSDDNEAYEEES